MNRYLLLFVLGSCLATSRPIAAREVLVNFELATQDKASVPVTEHRSYVVYRPDALPRSRPVPLVLVAGGGAKLLQSKAAQAGFVVVACSFTGNSLGNGWNNHDPRSTGWEDFDYFSAVIERVRVAENCDDAFICGFSTGGHTAYAFACERPAQIRAACSVDEFMGRASNVPHAPVSILAIHGTSDTAVPYAMGKDSIDAWRTMNGLMGALAITTHESSPRQPGSVTQATWRGGRDGTQVAFVTIVGGEHRWPEPDAQSGYDSAAGMWAFFSQFLTRTQPAPMIVSVPVSNTQMAGRPASFWVSATGRAPLRYQWQKNGADIPGATANWLTVPAVSSGDDGATFRAVVSNDAGRATSSDATLTVRPAPIDPVIKLQPVDRIVSAGQPVRFTVVARGNGSLQYQWRKNGMNLRGANGPVFALRAAITPDSGATFSVLVSSAAGSVMSVSATLTVTPATGAPVILHDPERVRINVAEIGTFSVTATSPTPMTYQWQQGALTTNMVDIPGATGASYSTPRSVLGDHRTLFRCVVSNAAGNATSACEMLLVTAVTKAAVP